MASAPSDLGPVRGRIDREGRLVSADPPLRRLQEEAGSAMGKPLALPQLAAVGRSALKLGVPLARSVIAASSSEDFDLWVRAVPDADGVLLHIEGWQARPASGPRLTVIAGGRDADLAGMADTASRKVLRTDAELRIVSVDQALARHLSAEFTIGQPLTRFLQLLDNGDGTMPLLQALGAHQDFEGQRVRVRNEREDQATLSGRAVLTDDDRFDGFEVEVELDGTDLPEVPQAHDSSLDDALRSPLDQIIAAADRIVDRADGPLRSDYAAYASDIAAAGRHLLSVIRSMSEEQVEAADKVDLIGLSREAVTLASANAEEAEVSIEIDDHEGPLHGHGEPRAILQILVNILGNAIRHSPKGGTVAVVFDEDDKRSSVTIADQGPGIERRDQQRIFERYEQGPGPGSAGLGLAISRRLARSMGGDVVLESAPGEGARFTLQLPRA